MIFQEPMTSLNPVFTIGTQISENIRRHQSTSFAQAREKTLQMLEAVGIPAPKLRISQYPHELSGGMRQRIMIAMALSCQPSVLIADEPTTALDVTIQAQIFDLLRHIQEEMGTSVILITHDMSVIAEFADRVAVMYAGRKIEEGLVRDIIDNPHHPYTQGLINCVPVLKKDPGPERVELNEIPGVVPSMAQLGTGCSFAPRCHKVIERCYEEARPKYRLERTIVSVAGGWGDRMSTEVTLKVDNLRTYFKVRRPHLFAKQPTVYAVDGVSFEIASGRLLVWLGESGCGKSTTAFSVLRLVEPTSGSIVLKGIDICR